MHFGRPRAQVSSEINDFRFSPQNEFQADGEDWRDSAIKALFDLQRHRLKEGLTIIPRLALLKPHSGDVFPAIRKNNLYLFICSSGERVAQACSACGVEPAARKNHDGGSANENSP